MTEAPTQHRNLASLFLGLIVLSTFFSMAYCSVLSADYILKDGSVSLTANWNQGAFNLTNVNSWFLGHVNASLISLTLSSLNISDWGTYIDQAVTATSGATFANLTLTDDNLSLRNDNDNGYLTISGSSAWTHGSAIELAGQDHAGGYMMFIIGGAGYADPSGSYVWERRTSGGLTQLMSLDKTGLLAVKGGLNATSFAIGANNLTTSEWAFLDGQDQAVKKSSNVQFGTLSVGDVNPGYTFYVSARGWLTSYLYASYFGSSGTDFITYPAGFTRSQIFYVGNAGGTGWIEGLRISQGGNLTVNGNVIPSGVNATLNIGTQATSFLGVYTKNIYTGDIILNKRVLELRNVTYPIYAKNGTIIGYEVKEVLGEVQVPIWQINEDDDSIYFKSLLSDKISLKIKQDGSVTTAQLKTGDVELSNGWTVTEYEDKGIFFKNPDGVIVGWIDDEGFHNGSPHN